MTQVHLDRLTRRYGRDVTALSDLTLTAPAGQVTALLGPSGCGKTTALKLVAGLLPPTSGRVWFDDRDVTDVPAERRGAVMVFQDHRLFPYLSAADNVAFGLRMRGVGARDRRAAASAMLDRVGLTGLGDRRPAELSGGQQQRVALARALVLDPVVLLLDEPLANLDVHLRDDLRTLLLDLQAERELTMVVVTHDQEEAVVLADHLALVFDGVLHQHGAPRTFFERPATASVARFFGTPNLLPGSRHGDRVSTPLGRLRVADGVGPDGAVTLVIRPERIVPAADPDAENAVVATVVSSSFLGTRTRAVVEVAGHRLTVDTAGEQLADVGPGAQLTLALPAEALWHVPREVGGPAAVADDLPARA